MPHALASYPTRTLFPHALIAVFCRRLAQETREAVAPYRAHDQSAVGRAGLLVQGRVMCLFVAFEVWLIDCESRVHDSLKNDAIRLNLDPILLANLNIELTVSITYHSLFQIKADAVNTGRMFQSDPGVLAYLDSGDSKIASTALPVLTGLFIPIFACLTIKLKADFGWRKYRIAGGDKDLERAFVWYHNFLLLQKFSFLFVLSFGSINSVLITAVTDEIPSIPATVSLVVSFLPFMGHYAVRRERKKLGCIVVLMYLVIFAMCAYTLWFTLNSWQAFRTNNEKRFTYDGMLTTLLAYAIVTLLVLGAAAGTGAVCVWSFGSGLKNALDKERLRVKGEQKAQHIDLDE
ncbi:hypothetical protein HDU81_010298 [Chytriomyces hyalinus]|nr:hypothetical protein HDU81_010298 [Chytriomyces hyalinus]